MTTAEGAAVELSTSLPSRRVLRAVLRGPFTARTWRELAYVVGSAPLDALGFGLLVSWTFWSGLLVVTLVGLPLFGLSTYGARAAGRVWRAWSGRLLGDRLPEPPAIEKLPGLLGWLHSVLRDGVGWRARAYVVVRLPLGLVMSYATGFVWVGAAIGISYPLWGRRGVTPHGDGPWPYSPFGHTWWQIVATFLLGVVLLFIAPWVVRGLVWTDRQLQRFLLSTGGLAARVTQLQRARAIQAEDTAATLRRIERDLHDGAQAQLTTLAMSIGRAQEKLDVPGVPTDARALVDTAHQQAKDALVLLRGIARSIHPPALDVGLDNALATLVSRSVIPASLSTSLDVRPSAAIETTAYFAVAELLTNCAKHSGATHVDVDARVDGGRLVLHVADDGVGGARGAAGTGLPGLADRLAAVDGSLVVDSPVGGPTTVRVELPLHA